MGNIMETLGEICEDLRHIKSRIRQLEIRTEDVEDNGSCGCSGGCHSSGDIKINTANDLKVTCKSSIIRQRDLGDGRMGLDDSEVSTRLLGKEWSPMIVRKTYVGGWPMWVGLIIDSNLSDLDKLVQTIIQEAKDGGIIENNIQSIRNFCGYVTERIVEHYDSKKKGVVEGCAVIAYWDKTFCSSLWGDMMTHGSCRSELYSIINTLPHI